MPLPDADPDKRIYALLKNTDLENLSFADFQGVAEKVFAEQGAEDTLRRIVLVNLARLAVAGEWNGLTSAGGGTISPTAMKAQSYNSTRDQYVLGNGVVWGATAASTAVGTELSANYTLYRPFIAPNSGTIADVNMWVGTAAAGENVEFGIYANDDDTGLPTGSVLTKCDLSLGSTGLVTQSSLTGTATLTRGTQYWFVMSQTQVQPLDASMVSMLTLCLQSARWLRTHSSKGR